jgi:hypothetical protein
MKTFSIIIMTAICMLACTAQGEPEPLRLSGGFIQYWKGMETWGKDKWHPVLEAMQKAGMNTVVIQQLAAETDTGKTEWYMAEGADATTVILDYAAQHGMVVYVGLYRHLLNGDTGSTDPVFLKRAEKDNLEVAEAAAKKYGSSEAFAGWYIPLEPWTSNKATLMAFKPFFQSVSKGCKNLVNKQVAFSPFVNLCPASLEIVQAAYKELLPDSGLDLLMLQDGVGARNLDDAGVKKNAKYFEAVGSACEAANILFWANVECFTSFNGNSPAKPGRFLLQRKSVPTAKAVVTFDFLHYMNPVDFPDSWGSEWKKEMKALYDAYMKEITPP